MTKRGLLLYGLALVLFLGAGALALKGISYAATAGMRPSSHRRFAMPNARRIGKSMERRETNGWCGPWCSWPAALGPW